jgi:hypothetical protein
LKQTAWAILWAIFLHSHLVTLFGTYLRLQLVGDLEPALQLDGRGPGSILKFDLGSAKFVPQNLNLRSRKTLHTKVGTKIRSQSCDYNYNASVVVS